MKTTEQNQFLQFGLCLNNKGYAASLEVGNEVPGFSDKVQEDNMTYKTQKTFTEFKDSVCSKFSDWGLSNTNYSAKKKKVDYWFWDNKYLYPEHDAITDKSTVSHYLRHAKQHDTLEQIHNYIDPLAFTVSIGRPGVSHYHTYKFRCFNLSTIRFIASGGEVPARFIADPGDVLVIKVPFFEYELWMFHCQHWSDTSEERMCGFFKKSV